MTRTGRFLAVLACAGWMACGGGGGASDPGTDVDSIEPAFESVKGQDGDKLEPTVRANARRVADLLNHIEPVISEAVTAGQVKVVAGRYDLTSGKIEILQ